MVIHEKTRLLLLDKRCTDNSCLQGHYADDMHKYKPEKPVEEHDLERLAGLIKECGIKFETKYIEDGTFVR